MQDGIIKGVGNSRYLKSVPSFLSLYPTYEAFCEALIAGTLPIDLNGINEAGWTQTGTPLNKASLLKDTTAALYGLENTAVPDDVLAKLPSRFDPKVGDALQTLRTDLGEKWLLCNGAMVSTAVYPELTELLPQEYGLGTISGIYRYTPNDILFHDGKWVMVGNHAGSAEDGFGTYILTATDPAGEWSYTQISEARRNLLYAVSYAGGRWVIVGSDISSGTHRPWIFTATNLDGPWTGRQIGNESTPLLDIACHDGTWVAVGYYGSSGYIYTSTDPTGDWIVSEKFSEKFNKISYANGTWIAVTANSYIFTASNPTGAWTRFTVYRDGQEYSENNAIETYNGTSVIAGGHRTSESTGAVSPCVYASTNQGLSWTEVKVGTVSASSFTDIACSEETWYVSLWANNNIYIYTATDPAGEWTELTTIETPSQEWSSSWRIEVAEGETVLAGQTVSPSYYPAVATSAGTNLPTISVDGVYTYIKAKE